MTEDLKEKLKKLSPQRKNQKDEDYKKGIDKTYKMLQDCLKIRPLVTIYEADAEEGNQGEEIVTGDLDEAILEAIFKASSYLLCILLILIFQTKIFRMFTFHPN